MDPNKTLVGLPDWAYGDVILDAEAEPPAGTAVNVTQMRKMMDALLADRFQLRYHIETRTMPVLFLQVSGDGPHHVRASPVGQQSLELRIVGGAVFGRGASMDELAGKIAAYYEDRPVLNRTGLNGSYDIDGPAPGGIGMDRDSNQTAILREVNALGLKLVSGKAAVPIVVVDHVTLPTPNP